MLIAFGQRDRPSGSGRSSARVCTNVQRFRGGLVFKADSQKDLLARGGACECVCPLGSTGLPSVVSVRLEVQCVCPVGSTGLPSGGGRSSAREAAPRHPTLSHPTLYNLTPYTLTPYSLHPNTLHPTPSPPSPYILHPARRIPSGSGRSCAREADIYPRPR